MGIATVAFCQYLVINIIYIIYNIYHYLIHIPYLPNSTSINWGSLSD
jgi:hypothetical protein